MSQVPCKKCGAQIEIDKSAAQAVCPQCHATYALRHQTTRHIPVPPRTSTPEAPSGPVPHVPARVGFRAPDELEQDSSYVMPTFRPTFAQPVTVQPPASSSPPIAPLQPVAPPPAIPAPPPAPAVPLRAPPLSPPPAAPAVPVVAPGLPETAPPVSATVAAPVGPVAAPVPGPASISATQPAMPPQAVPMVAKVVASPLPSAPAGRQTTRQVVPAQVVATQHPMQAPLQSDARAGAPGWLPLIPGVALILLSGVIWFFRSGVPEENPEQMRLEQRQPALMEEVRKVRGEGDRETQELLVAQQQLETETAEIQKLKSEDELLDYRLGALTKGEDGKLAAISREKDRIDSIREHNQEVLARVLNDNDPTKAVERVEKSTVVILTDRGAMGSGFICAAEGLAITNYHVVEGSGKLTLKIQKRDTREQVEIVGTRILAVDVEHDLALLELPPPDAAVAHDGKYPALSIRRNAVRSGENVFAVGSPGVEDLVLDYTVTKGIISNPKRDLQGQTVMQTSCPVNPGNSGGPLCDSTGSVVGVVVAKGRFAEAVTFAIPIPQVLNLISSSNREPYTVPKEGLAAWEKKNDPLAHLRRQAVDALAERTIELPGIPTDLKLSPDGRSLYVIMGGSGTIQQMDPATRKAGASYRLPGQITACAFQGNSILLADGPGRTIHRISRQNLTLIDKTPTAVGVTALMALGRFGDDCLAFSSGNVPVLITRSAWSHGLDRQIPFDGLPDCMGIDADSRYVVLTGLPGQNTLEFALLPLPGAIRDFTTLHEYRKRGNVPAQTILALQERYEAAIRRYTIPVPHSGLVLPTTLLCPPNRLISGRLCIRLGLTPQAEGLFEPSPYSTSDLPGLRERRAAFQLMDSIVTISPDGRYAASGIGIYDVNTRKLLKLLPTPSVMHVFSQDGKSIYFASPTCRQLYLLEDWQKNAPAPEIAE